MTAATYTFTLSAAQSSASSMVVAMRAKTGSSIPGDASRWQGGVMPQATLNWAAGVTTATATVNTAPNATVDGDAEYEWYKVSSTPSDLTLDTAALPKVTITDDDSSGGGGGDTIVYGPQTTADSGYVQVGSAKQRISGKISDTLFSMSFASNADGTDRIEMYHDGFAAVKITRWSGGTSTVVNVSATYAGGNSIPAGSDFTATHDPASATLTLVVNGSTRLDGFPYGGGAPKTGTYARFQHNSGSSVTITRLA